MRKLYVRRLLVALGTVAGLIGSIGVSASAASASTSAAQHAGHSHSAHVRSAHSYSAHRMSPALSDWWL